MSINNTYASLRRSGNVFARNAFVIVSLYCFSCNDTSRERSSSTFSDPFPHNEAFLVVLGNVQDGGSPHIACKKDCCRHLFEDPDPDRKVVSLGLVDPENDARYLFEATPDITVQMDRLTRYSSGSQKVPDAIFITHAHIGHYAGLMYLGKEAMNASSVPVYVMPGMSSFLKNNGPWNQLVANKNISLKETADQQEIRLPSGIRVVPFIVPHRDEYSETVGYKITGPAKTALFIPDIDKWSKWETNIIDLIKDVDYAFLDATFFDAVEIDHRDISEIPHPFVVESMLLFKGLPPDEKEKIRFIHMNHTNPLLNPLSEQSKLVLSKGFKIARFGQTYKL